MKRIFLFRHGETDWNAGDRIQGQEDIPLNDRGRAQAATLSRAFKHHRPEIILSSDLKRAHETARIAAGPHGIPIQLDPELREAFVGKAQGLTYSQFIDLYGEKLLDQWRSGDRAHLGISFPGGETGQQVLARAESMLKKCVAHPAQSIALSTHGGVIRRIAQAHLGFDRPDTHLPAINGVMYELEAAGVGKYNLKLSFSF